MKSIFSLMHSLTMLGALAALSSAHAQKSPNILFILVDDLAYNDIGCYTFPGNLVSPGHLVPSPYPGKAAFAAPNQAIAQSNTAGLPSREITLPEALKGAGYATAAFGKWHLGNGEQHMKGDGTIDTQIATTFLHVK